MTPRDQTEAFKQAIEAAEAASAGLADPHLRSIAFERVLEHLLSTAPVERSAPGPSGREAADSLRQRTRRPAHDGPTAWIQSLRDEGFFGSSKSLAEVTEAVRARGHNVESKYVTAPLEKLVQSKVLRRERAPKSGQKRGLWTYSDY